MISKMESQLGVRGRPNTATRWYSARNGSYFNNAAWCNQLITWAAYNSGNYQAVCFGNDYAYTVYHAQRFQQAGRWHTDTGGIQRGDIVFFDWGGTNSVGNIDHIGIVTSTDGRNVYTIEGNTSDSCARRVRGSSSIVGYGRPAYTSATPAPSPKPPASTSGYKAPAFPKGLAPDKSTPSAKGLQAALKAAGYLNKSVAADSNYGPLTQAAVTRFHNRNPQYADRPGDPAIGPLGWARLHVEAYA
jgi:hypothetical protein